MWRRGARWGCWVILIALLVTVLRPVAPGRALRGTQGIQGGWAVDDEGNTQFEGSTSATLPLMREAGAGWVRINFRLGACFRDWTMMPWSTRPRSRACRFWA